MYLNSSVSRPASVTRMPYGTVGSAGDRASRPASSTDLGAVRLGFPGEAFQSLGLLEQGRLVERRQYRGGLAGGFEERPVALQERSAGVPQLA